MLTVAWPAPENQPSATSPPSSGPSRVLDALADGGGELGTNELARRTGINASTRLAVARDARRAALVEHVAETGRYRLGLRLLQLGNAVLARLDLREIARPHLDALVEETGETVTLSAPGERDAVTVDFVQSGSSVQSVARLGRPSVAHATATGKVLLAFGGVPLPAGELGRFTQRTVTDRRKLAAEIERVARQGWARPSASASGTSTRSRRPVLDRRRASSPAILGVQGPPWPLRRGEP